MNKNTEQWLEDEESDQVKVFIQKENLCYDQAMKKIEGLQQQVAEEMIARLNMDRKTPAYRQGNFEYYFKDIKNLEKPLFCRRNLKGRESVIFDENCELKTLIPDNWQQAHVRYSNCDPSQRYFPIAIDTSGNERFNLYLKDMQIKKFHSTKIPNVSNQVAWLDSQRLIYLSLDQRNRTYQAHLLNLSKPEQSQLLYEEKNIRFSLHIRRSASGKYVFLSAVELQNSTEVYFVACDVKTPEFTIIAKRESGFRYQLTHHENYFYFISNHEGDNKGLYRTTVDNIERHLWECILAVENNVELLRLQAFADHLVIYKKSNQQVQINVFKPDNRQMNKIILPDENYVIQYAENRDYHIHVLRFYYSSLVQPYTLYEYSLSKRNLTAIDQIPVRNYLPLDYQSEFLLVPVVDEWVPISLVYKKSLRQPTGNSLLLYTYGAYGHSLPADFTSLRLSFLDRGGIYAIAHVRGGGELGPTWHQKGKLNYKKQSITDFIACADYLCANGYTSKGQLSIMGESAGGLVVTAAVNHRPDLCKALIAINPFVDVVNTLLNDKLPGTSEEWIEWGNPHDVEVRSYQASYDPINNIQPANYPDMLLSCALNDAQVPYWEACKYQQILKRTMSNDSQILLQIKTDSGHGSSQARYSFINQQAQYYAYIINKTMFSNSVNIDTNTLENNGNCDNCTANAEALSEKQRL